MFIFVFSFSDREKDLRMPNPRKSSPPILKQLTNHAFIIIFLRAVRRLLDELFTEEVEYHSFGQSPFLTRMSKLLWPLCLKARKFKDTSRNIDRVITDIVEYIDECNQRARLFTDGVRWGGR